jgi:hypothetical protein
MSNRKRPRGAAGPGPMDNSMLLAARFMLTSQNETVGEIRIALSFFERFLTELNLPPGEKFVDSDKW